MKAKDSESCRPLRLDSLGKLGRETKDVFRVWRNFAYRFLAADKKSHIRCISKIIKSQKNVLMPFDVMMYMYIIYFVNNLAVIKNVVFREGDTIVGFCFAS